MCHLHLPEFEAEEHRLPCHPQEPDVGGIGYICRRRPDRDPAMRLSAEHPLGQSYQSDFIDGLGLEPDRTEDGDPGDDLEYV